jgi:hypothetical protein
MRKCRSFKHLNGYRSHDVNNLATLSTKEVAPSNKGGLGFGYWRISLRIKARLRIRIYWWN